jgi:serine/threonine protein kinase
MSPQVVKRYYDGYKADVWSCGVMVHVLLTGYAPFDGPTYNDILKAITEGNMDFEVPDVSEECLVSEDLPFLKTKAVHQSTSHVRHAAPQT